MLAFSSPSSRYSIPLPTAANREWRSRRRISPLTDLGKSTSGALWSPSNGSWIRRRSCSTARSISSSESSWPNAGSQASIPSLRRWYVVLSFSNRFDLYCLFIAELVAFFLFEVIRAGSMKRRGIAMEFRFF